MFIKTLKISGFKSYGAEIVIDDFSPNHNSIIGSNGSGKSNIFRAIQFVLCEKQYTNLSEKQRKSILNEDSGNQAQYASVEIVFDNTSGRFPGYDTDEVILKRMMSMQNDSLKINNKTVKRDEYRSHLKAAGFSTENPYYIVQQGKVNALCIMSDHHRLDLLKNIAGAIDFEAKRKKAEDDLAEHKRKLQRAIDSIQVMDNRLSQLAEEKKELMEYNKLETRRQTLKILLNNAELKATRDNIDEYKLEKQNLQAVISDAGDSAGQLEEQLLELKDKILSIKQSTKNRMQEKQLLEIQVVSAMEMQNSAQIEVSESQEKKKLLNAKLQRLDQLLSEETTKIEALRNELADTKPAHTKQVSEVDNLKGKIASTLPVYESLMEKKGRSGQFHTKRDRNKNINKQLESIKETIALMETYLEETDITFKKSKHDVTTFETQIKEEQRVLTGKKKLSSEKSRQIEKLESKLREKSSKRKEARRIIDKNRQLERNLEEKTLKNDTWLKQSVGFRRYENIQRVLEFPPTIAKGKVFGPLYKLLELDSDVEDKEALYKAIEQSVGPELNKIICDKNSTASNLIEEMKKRRVGSLTFIPLRFLQKKYKSVRSLEHYLPHNYEKLQNHPELGQHCTPLHHFISFREPSLEKVLWPVLCSILGKVIFYSGDKLDEVSKFCLENEVKVKLVDVHGTIVENSGLTRGGRVSASRNQLAAFKSGLDLDAQCVSLRENTKKQSIVVEEVSQDIIKLQNDIETIRVQKREYDAVIHDLGNPKHVQALNQSLEGAKREMVKCEAKKKNYANRKQVLQEKIIMLTKELDKPLQSSLSEEEEANLQKLESEYKKLKNVLKEAETSLEKQDTVMKGILYEIKFLETEKIYQLNKDKKTTEKELMHLDSTAQEEDTSETTKSMEEKVLELKGALNSTEKLIEDANEELESLEKTKEDVKDEIKSIKRRIEEDRVHLRKIAAKYDLEESKKENFIKQTMEMKTTPKEFMKLNRDQLIKKLKQTTKTLTKFTAINQKAMNQYDSFTKDRDELGHRKEKVELTLVKIEELIDKLEAQKHSDVMTTFNRVKFNFAKVFKELVPEGWGQLVLLTDTKSSSNTTESKYAGSESDSSMEDVDLEDYIGISPRVCFRKGKNETAGLGVKKMNELSGGQRALVAICFIFAIQRVDPAPFYLFDELDQALDEKNRLAVANLIKRQAAGEVEGDELMEVNTKAQFLTTSFRPELVSASDKVFGVNFDDTSGSVKELTKAQGLDFIQKINEQEGDIIEEHSKRARKSMGAEIREF